MGDVDEQLLPGRVCLGRKELEAESGPMGPEDVLNVHGGEW